MGKVQSTAEQSNDWHGDTYGDSDRISRLDRKQKTGDTIHDI
jgi:hypothetical protein